MEDEKLIATLMDIQSSLAQIRTDQVVSSSRMTAMEADVGELTRTVQGYNGNPGMVTDIALLHAAVRRINLEPIITELALLKLSVSSMENRDRKEEDKKDDGTVTVTWLFEKILSPIIQPAVAAIILYILFNVIPHVTVPGGN